jgi:catechol 2,3-dioxygenase-like lactoylglutathione lyase family enzyme
MGEPIQISGVVAVMLGVKDIPAAAAFYTQKLGLKILMQESAVCLLQCGPVLIGLNRDLGQTAASLVGATELVLRVPAVRGARQTLGAEGISFVSEPHQITPTDWVAHFRDVDGHLLSIFGPEGTA